MIGVVLAALILQSKPPAPGTAEPLSSVTNDRVLNLSMILMATQAMYGVPVLIVRDHLRLSKSAAMALAASPFVYIAAYIAFLSGVRAGTIQVDSWVVWPLPLGAGLIVLVAMIAIVANRLRRIERRRSAPRDTSRL